MSAAHERPVRRLVLLRHGQTAWNLERRAQGHLDVPLSEVGHAQARRVAPVVAGWEPTYLWASDLERARETVAPIATACAMEVAFDPRWREQQLGERTGLTMAEFEERFPEAYEAWHTGVSGPEVPGAEDRVALKARMAEVLTECTEALAPGEIGVAVTHGWCTKVGLAGWLGWPDGVLPTLRGLDNCAWAVLADTAPGEAWRLEAWNRSADFASSAPVG